jgi:hypothetical protein
MIDGVVINANTTGERFALSLRLVGWYRPAKVIDRGRACLDVAKVISQTKATQINEPALNGGRG